MSERQSLQIQKPQAEVPARAGIAVCVIGLAAPILVLRDLDILGQGGLVELAAAFALPALLLVLYRGLSVFTADFLSVRVVRRTGQLCLVTFLLGEVARALGQKQALNHVLKLAGLEWTLAAVALAATGVAFVCLGRDLERNKVGLGTFFAVLFSFLPLVAVPNFHAARMRAEERACFANQKTIVGAIEMYNLDKSLKLDPSGGYAKYADELRHGGYLRNIMWDPGQGPDTQGHYVLTSEGNGIRCTVHGTFGQDGRKR